MNSFSGKEYSRNAVKAESPRRTEPDNVVTERRHVPATIGRTHVQRMIVERAATQHTAILYANTKYILFIFIHLSALPCG